jgi:hypothetical protein
VDSVLEVALPDVVQPVAATPDSYRIAWNRDRLASFIWFVLWMDKRFIQECGVMDKPPNANE